MASQWYYKAFGQELGPMPFRELVHLARCGELGPDDKVRATYEPEWRRADSVVGLFYMARQPAEVEVEEPESLSPAPVVPKPLEPVVVEPIAQPVDEEPPRWLQRVLERVRSGEISPARARRVLGELIKIDHRLSDEATAFLKEAGGKDLSARANWPSEGTVAADSGVGSGGEFTRLVEEALAEIDKRLENDSPKPRTGVLGRLMDSCRSAFSDRRLLQQVVRLGGAMIAANLAVLWVESWSAREALRFPGLLDKQGVRVFPLIGECQPMEYWFFAVDLMLLAGAAAYFGVRWIESHLE